MVKRYGSTMAVNDRSFSIRPGLVTGFLGPNGAGKTTTMRMILGLDAPTQGSVTVGGRSSEYSPGMIRTSLIAVPKRPGHRVLAYPGRGPARQRLPLRPHPGALARLRRDVPVRGHRVRHRLDAA